MNQFVGFLQPFSANYSTSAIRLFLPSLSISVFALVSIVLVIVDSVIALAFSSSSRVQYQICLFGLSSRMIYLVDFKFPLYHRQISEMHLLLCLPSEHFTHKVLTKI